MLYGTGIEGIYFYATNEAKYLFLNHNGFHQKVRWWLGLSFLEHLNTQHKLAQSTHCILVARSSTTGNGATSSTTTATGKSVNWLVYYFYVLVALDGRNRNVEPRLPEEEVARRVIIHVDGCYIIVIVIGVLLLPPWYHTSFTHPALLTIAICLSSIPVHLYTLYTSTAT